MSSPFCGQAAFGGDRSPGCDRRGGVWMTLDRVEFLERPETERPGSCLPLHLDAEVAKNDDRGWEGRETLKLKDQLFSE